MESQQSSEEFNTNYKRLKAWMTARKVKSNYQKMVLATYSHKFKDSTTLQAHNQSEAIIHRSNCSNAWLMDGWSLTVRLLVLAAMRRNCSRCAYI